MILSDKDIKEFIKKKDLLVQPFEESNVGPCSIDLRLGNTFRLFKNTSKAYIDPHKQEDPFLYTEKVVCDKFVIHPRDFVLGSTLEKVKLPNNLVGRLDGRSSWGRVGIIIHSTAGFIDSGFEGTITLEITNIGKMPVALRKGDRICQMSLHTMLNPSEVPYNLRPGSKYNKQEDASPSLVFKDKYKT